MGEAEWLFWASALFVVYAYVGYPVLLALGAWWRPSPPVLKTDSCPAVSLVIVAHDEERHIEKKINDCLGQDYPSERLELVVVSDGSRDRTDSIVATYADRGVRLLRVAGPRGKPAALNQVVPMAHGEVLVLSDARQGLDPGAVRRLVRNLGDPTVGAVSGELHILGPKDTVTGGGVGAYWRFEKWVRQQEARLDSTIGVTGALYAVRRELFPPLPESVILDDVAVPMAVVAAGYRVAFEPEARAFDVAAPTAAREFRRKVRTLAGNFQLVALWPELLNPKKNRLWWQFASHKLARLVVPWALLVMLATSIALGLSRTALASLYALAAVGQAAFYLAGLAGWVLESVGKRHRLLSMAAAFVLLNAAAACALPHFISGRTRVTWKAAAPTP